MARPEAVSTSSGRPAQVLPALYMVWDAAVTPSPALVASGYDVTAVCIEDAERLRPVIELDGALTTNQWTDFVDRLLPDGLFTARVVESQEDVGTVSAIHNPRGARFFFPGGGEIGYLVVRADHRGRGLGLALVTAAVSRFRSAGYRTIWLGVQDWRHSAIRTYLAAGFVPFLHAPDPNARAERWRNIFSAIGLALNAERWPRTLPNNG